MVRPIRDGWVTTGGARGDAQLPPWQALDDAARRGALPTLAGVRSLIVAHAPSERGLETTLAAFLALPCDAGTPRLCAAAAWGEPPPRAPRPDRGGPSDAGLPHARGPGEAGR